jgi:hypothetical protein
MRPILGAGGIIASVIYVWVRATVDWADAEAVRAQLPPRIATAVAAWDATFSMPWHLFRHRVREIAKENHARIANAVVARWEEIPDGALFLPVDDDDWFAPEIADVLEGAWEEGVSAIRWRPSFFELPFNRGHAFDVARRRLFRRWPTFYLCTTNNYALVKGPGVEPLARSHEEASRWVATRPPGEVRWIERRLSAMNRTFASTTSLWGTGEDRHAIARRYRRYRAVYHRPVYRGLAWARPYVAEMAALMDELSVRR